MSNTRHPLLPEYAPIGGPAVYSDYQLAMLHEQANVLNTKTMKALLETLSEQQAATFTHSGAGCATLYPDRAGLKAENVISVTFDEKSHTVYDAKVELKDQDGIYPFRAVDYAMAELEKDVPEDTWLEGLTESDRKAVKDAIRKGVWNIPIGVAIQRYAPLFWHIDVIKRAGMLPSYNYGSMGIEAQTVSYDVRPVVELTCHVCREDGMYEMPFGLWPVSHYEARILDFFDAMSKKQTPDAMKILNERVDVIADFLKRRAPIHDHEFSRCHALARARFPMASDEDIHRAIRSLSDSKFYSREISFTNHLIAPWKR